MVVIEPMTVIGGILGHAKSTVDYLKDVKNASKDQKDLLNEIIATQSILTQLQSHAKDAQWKVAMDALNQKDGALEQLTAELEKMETKLKSPSGKVGKAVNVLAWHFNKDDVKKHFERIGRINGVLQLALQNNHRFILHRIVR